MPKRRCFIGLTAVFLLAPTLVPIPNGDWVLRTDEAKAGCNANCMSKCREATSRGVYLSMQECVAIWSPRNEDRITYPCPVGTCSRHGTSRAANVMNCSAANCRRD